jgi:hypothetical protein
MIRLVLVLALASFAWLMLTGLDLVFGLGLLGGILGIIAGVFGAVIAVAAGLLGVLAGLFGLILGLGSILIIPALIIMGLVLLVRVA